MLAEPEPKTVAVPAAQTRSPRATKSTATKNAAAKNDVANGVGSKNGGPGNLSTIVSPERAEDIRIALMERLGELTAEHADARSELEITGGAAAGDDVADLGTKAFAREQEMVLMTTIQGRIDQVERALERVANGQYGWCEGCAKEIPVARLAAFPSVTLCVTCKQLEERR